MDETTAEPDLCQLLRQDWEDPNYDLKGLMAWDERDVASIGLIKDILALANSGGGSLAIGVSERNGRIEFDGLSKQQLETWDPSRFGAKVNRYAEPAIQCTVRKIQCDGAAFVLISVPPFIRVPHYCKRDYNGVLKQHTVYVRTPNAASAPVQDASTFLALVDRAVIARQDEFGIAPLRWTLDHWARDAHEEVFPCPAASRRILRNSKLRRFVSSVVVSDPCAL